MVISRRHIVVLRLREPAERSSILQQLGMDTSDADGTPIMPYGVVTLHRPSNVDDLAFFRDILDPLLTIGGEGAARLSYHPRTFARIDEFGFAGTVRHAGST